MDLTRSEAAALLRDMDDVLVLAHENPDGDAVGSVYALALALQAMGKRVRPCLDTLPHTMEGLAEGLSFPDFTPRYIVAVDVSDRKILGVTGAGLARDCRVDLCVDHHVSNTHYAQETCLDASAAAAAEIVYDLVKLLNVPLTRRLADCLYTGVSTDTGCFRYGNTTARSFEIAAELVRAGADIARINKIHFETKTRQYAALEREALANLTLYDDGRCALMTVTHEMIERSGVQETEMQALSALPRQIEGVLTAATLKERDPGEFRVSIRTNENADAQAMASLLGGGGHRAAAGCNAYGTRAEAEAAVLAAMRTVLRDQGLL